MEHRIGGGPADRLRPLFVGEALAEVDGAVLGGEPRS